MKVYKFGGASVKSADGVRNLKYIVEDCTEPLFIIISAMGKTTNALEEVLDAVMKGNKTQASALFSKIEEYHNSIMAELFEKGEVPAAVLKLYKECREIIGGLTPQSADFERTYDSIVSFGELISTTIISEYLNRCGVRNHWVDMRKCLITDNNHKYANVDIEISTILLAKEIENASEHIFIGQGFIGATIGGQTTTLGREGSDYSAAVTATILDAESVSIWKDVVGILNADPKIFHDTTYIPELTYLDAIELAYSGAQIIHPKTIKPLQNKNIPLYVRPFGDKNARGSVIKGSIDSPVDIPILILKRRQVLMTIRPQDFSFVLEERLAKIFTLLERYNIKTNLIQTSAVSMSLCIDDSRYLSQAMDEFSTEGFMVHYDTGMELLTIRGYNEKLLEQYSRDNDVVLLAQRTRNIVRIVRREGSVIY